MTPARRIQILVGLFLAWVVAELGLSTFAERVFGTFVGRELPWWILVAVMLVYVVFVERMPLASIGLKKPTWMSLVWGIVAGLTLFAGAGLIYAIVFPALHLELDQKAAAGIVETPFVYRLALVTRAAVAEEILYRGYPIERIKELTGSPVLAAVISWGMFTYAHLGYWGWAQLLIAGFGGLVLTIMYLWRRDLASNMIAHFISDAISFLLLPAVT